MIYISETWPYIALFAAILLFSNHRFKKYQTSQLQKEYGCGAIPSYPQWDPLLGTDIAFSMAKAYKNHRFLSWLKELHGKIRPKTFTVNFLGTRFIHTIESENMKALSSTVWKDFGVEPMRRSNGASKPFADKGVNTTDGHMWEHSRFLIKPYFMRDAFSNTDRLEKHTDNLLNLIPQDGSTFDMQTLLQRWFLDTSTHFLFGESISSLIYPERIELAWIMGDVLRGLRLRLQMGKFLWLFRNKAWMDAVSVVHDFVDRKIEQVYKEMKLLEKTKTLAEIEKERDDLLWSMAINCKDDKEDLRSQMLLLFIPNNDTTSIFTSNVFWNLARFPDVYAKLREEVLSYGDVPLTYETLRSMKYLDSVLNETHRLYPNSVTQVRMALKNSTLPLGGGPTGNEPILVRKGDVVQVNRSVMHRDKDIWGEDAEEFCPERWENLRPFWNFVPFGGGPRRCPAQLSVTIEASYAIAKFARLFKAIENRDPTPYVPVMRVGPVNANGVKIAAIPA